MLIRDGHSFIRGPGEHLFAQWYHWAVCREPCTKLGMNWEERILRLHWMVHAVNKHFINKCNVKYKPYGPWGHFLEQCTLKLITLSCGEQEAFPQCTQSSRGDHSEAGFRCETGNLADTSSGVIRRWWECTDERCHVVVAFTDGCCEPNRIANVVQVADT